MKRPSLVICLLLGWSALGLRNNRLNGNGSGLFLGPLPKHLLIGMPEHCLR